MILKQDCGNDESSDFIEDLDVFKRPPSPCNVIFEGANIVLEGKSSLRRRNKTRKVCVIVFFTLNNLNLIISRVSSALMHQCVIGLGSLFIYV